MLKHALSYARRGFSVFPLAGKRPLTAHGLKDATDSTSAVRRLWERHPDANIGIRTGERFFALDIDGAGGEDSLLGLVRERGPLPETVEIITGGGGRHLWFKAVSGLGNRVGVLPGLDVRGEAGYVIAPPSTHPNGRQYLFGMNCSNRIAEAPEWLVDLIRAPKTTVHAHPSGPVPEGQRNDTIARVSGKLLRQFALEPDFSLSLVLAFNAQYCQPPLPEAEVRRTFVSVAQKEATRRAGIPNAPAL